MLWVLPQFISGLYRFRKISVTVQLVGAWLCVCACLWECIQYVFLCVWATASSSFLLELQSVEVMKINERNGGGRLRSRYCLPVSGQSSIDPPVLHSATI